MILLLVITCNTCDKPSSYRNQLDRIEDKIDSLMEVER